MTYYITKNGNTILEFPKFDQKAIQTAFDTELNKLKDGEELEYWKADKKNIYPGMLLVFRQDGKFWKYTNSGRKQEYRRL